MCHNSGIESKQIERYMAFGLPQKAVRTVKYTMLKRQKQQYKGQQRQQDQSQNNSNAEDVPISSSRISIDGDSSTDFDIKLSQSTMHPKLSTTKHNQLEVGTVAAESIVGKTGIATAEALSTLIPNNNNKSNSSRSDILKVPKFCGRYRKVQQLQQQQESVISEYSSSMTTVPATIKAKQPFKLSSMKPSMDDALAIGTQMTRKFAERCHCLITHLQGSRLYTVLTRTTQPAHLIAICILSIVLLIVGPDLTTTATTMHSSQAATAATMTNGNVDDHNKVDATSLRHSSTIGGSTLAKLAYLGAFATHFGSQIWMTFVSGLSLYFSLPRHTFGQCQQILFPKYFALNAVLSISMLIIYVKYFMSGWTMTAGVQLGSLAVTAAIEVVVRLYLAPPMLRLMHEKYRIEDAIGSGQEVGSLVQGDLVECPHYQHIHKTFRRIHMTIAIGNMIVLLATCLQLYFLSLKIRIS